MKKTRYIFIGGSGRSGTTLVQKILLANDSISGGAEFYHTKGIFELYEEMQKHVEKGALQHESSVAHLKERFKRFYDSFFIDFKEEGTAYLSEKTPTNIDVSETLLRLYEDAVFINVYRDGRAVLNSHLQVKKRAWKKGRNLTEINVFRTSLYWKKCIQTANQCEEQYPDRFYSIRYEDLIEDPKKVFEKIFNDLGLDMHEEMVAPEKIELSDKKGHAHVNDVWYTKDMYERGLDASRKDQWKKELGKFQLLIANGIMYPELQLLGYQLSKRYYFLHRIMNFFIHWKSELKKWSILQPLLKLKRRLQ